MMTEMEKPRAYTTMSTDQVLQALSQRTELIQHMRWHQPPQPPWTTQIRQVILIHYEPPLIQNPALPPRAQTQQITEEGRTLVQAAEAAEQITTKSKKKKKRFQTKPTTHSSSTKITKTQTGKQPTEVNQAQPLSPSTTDHTTTSSTQQMTEEEMEQDSGEELLHTWVRQLQETQKLLPRTVRFNFSDDLFSIVSGTVSKQQISMVLESTKK